MSAFRLSSECSSSELQARIWYRELDSNQPHTDFQSAALPDELSRLKIMIIVLGKLVTHVRHNLYAKDTD